MSSTESGLATGSRRSTRSRERTVVPRRPEPGNKNKTPRERLRDEVEIALVKSGQFVSTTEPTLTPTELLTVGAILSPVERPTEWGIRTSIIRWFTHYRRLANEKKGSRNVASIVRIRRQQPSLQLEPIWGWVRHGEDLIPCFDEALGRSSLPLSLVTSGHVYEAHWQNYAIDLLAARVQLRRLLEPKRQGVFRYLDLPAELRTKICEYVMDMPTITRSWRSRLAVYGRDHEDPVADLKPDVRYDTHATPPIQEVLALLSVSKQIFTESVWIFYQMNEIKTRGTYQAKPCLEVRMPRLQYLGKVHIEYCTGGNQKVVADFYKQLLAVKKLKMVKLDFSGENWSADIKPISQYRSYHYRLVPIDATTVPKLRGLDAICMILAKAKQYQIIDSNRGAEAIREYVDKKVEEIKDDNIAAAAEKQAADDAKAEAAKAKKAAAQAKKATAAQAKKPAAQAKEDAVAVKQTSKKRKLDEPSTDPTESQTKQRKQPTRRCNMTKSSDAEDPSVDDDEDDAE